MHSHILIVGGAGAIGSLLTALIYKGKKIFSSSPHITILSRNSTRSHRLKKNGIKVSGLSHIFVPPKAISVISSEDLNRLKKKDFRCADLILICVKSYDTESAVLSALPFIGKNTIILTLQNGLGNFETIKSVLAKSRNFIGNKAPLVLAGSSTYGATKISDGNIIHTGKGEVVISYDTPIEKYAAERVIEILSSSDIDKVKVLIGRHRILWSKVLINSAVNPVGAIFNITNGEILTNDIAMGIVKEAADEALTVAKFFFKNNKISFVLNYKELMIKIRTVLRQTAQNKNSMLQDILAGRPTEIDAINGAIIHYGKKFGIATPINKLLFNSVKVLTKSKVG